MLYAVSCLALGSALCVCLLSPSLSQTDTAFKYINYKQRALPIMQSPDHNVHPLAHQNSL